MCGGGSAGQYFLVEWYQQDIGDGALNRLTCAVAGRQVRLLMTLTAPSDETVFGLFEADSAEAVIETCRQAGWHTDRITGGIQARINGVER